VPAVPAAVVVVDAVVPEPPEVLYTFAPAHPFLELRFLVDLLEAVEPAVHEQKTKRGMAWEEDSIRLPEAREDRELRGALDSLMSPWLGMSK